jgi:tyrosyl-tRNA synthetase
MDLKNRLNAMLEDLRERGLLYQTTEGDTKDGSALVELLAREPRIYIGFDPTADTLHVGSLVPLLALRRFKEAGLEPIVLLGGATALIGDPSGKSEERNLLDRNQVKNNVEGIRSQMSRILGLDDQGTGVRFVDNYDWISNINIVEFLRDYGKHFSVNEMMNKDSVKARLDREGVGISFTEFSYMILQSLDFHYLAAKYGCFAQAGGSDQWGNITAGLELIRRKMGKEAHALTFPLLTTSEGKKFGKTESGNVWLDGARTSPYAFYQFWINTPDSDVSKLLRFLTFFPMEEIKRLETAQKERPEVREAQKALAREMTVLVHGVSELEKVEAVSVSLFGEGSLAGLDEKTLREALDSLPHTEVEPGGMLPALADLLVLVGLEASKSNARKTIESGGIYADHQRQKDPKWMPTWGDLEKGFVLLRKGKKNYGVLKLKK